MAAMYGHTWASQYGSQPEGIAADTWAAALAGLSGHDLATGLQGCIASGAEWPPSAPRFRAMCLGIPSFEVVRNDFTLASDERSPFARMVWGFIDGYAYRQASTKDADRMLLSAYNRAVDDRMRGAPLPPVAVAEISQEQREVVPATPEQRQKHLDEIAKILHLSPDEVQAMGEEGVRQAGGEL